MDHDVTKQGRPWSIDGQEIQKRIGGVEAVEALTFGLKSAMVA